MAILDISMPEMDGLKAARQIRKHSPKTEILMLSMHYSDQLIREILEAGVRGYIVKSDSDRDSSSRSRRCKPQALFHSSRHRTYAHEPERFTRLTHQRH